MTSYELDAAAAPSRQVTPAQDVSADQNRAGRIRTRTRTGSGAAGAPEALLALVGLAAAGYGVQLLTAADPERIDGYGLLHAIPGRAMVCAGVLLVCFLGILHRGVRSRFVAGVLVLALVLLLDAAPVLVEGTARFPVAWTHAGFVDQLATHGRVLHSYDARMSWPGFFAAAAVLTSTAHSSALPLLAWTPFVLHVLYLGPLLLLVRTFVRDVPTRWFAVLLFYVGDWVGQTYFSPQGVAYLLLLSVLALLVSVFQWRPPEIAALVAVLPEGARRAGHRLSSLGVHAPPPTRSATATTLGAAGLVALMTLALLPSHQLTPVALLFDAAALLLVGRLAMSLYPVLVALATLGYLSLFTADYWLGHRQLLLAGGVSSFSSNLSDRVSGSDAHLLVVQLRLVATALLIVVAAVGVVRLARRGSLPPALVALAVASAPVPLLQTYGGEALLRVVFYTLPFLAMLGAHAVASRRGGLHVLTAGLLSAVLLAMFPLTRYGNESFERVAPDEIAAFRTVYDTATPGASIVVAVDTVPWKYRDLRTYEYTVLGAGRAGKPDPKLFQDRLRGLRGDLYVVLTRGQQTWGVELYGYPADWLDRYGTALARDPSFRPLLLRPDAQVFVRRSR